MLTGEHSQWLFDTGKVLFGIIAGAIITKKVEGKPKLITQWGHIAAFNANVGDNAVTINTHEVVVRNAGKQPAHNVRVTHNQLPEFNVSPSVPYSIENLPDGRKDIVFPILIPGQQLVISYLYFPPLYFSNVHAGIWSDEVTAIAVETEIQQKTPRWLAALILIGFLVGCGTMLYWLWKVAALLGL